MQNTKVAVLLALDGKLTLSSATFAIVNGGGTITLNAASGILDLAGLFDGQANGGTYALITGALAAALVPRRKKSRVGVLSRNHRALF